MYRLYGSLGTGSAAVEAALAESGAPYEVVTIDTKQDAHLTEEFRRINPRQQVQALQLPDGSVTTEGSAMLLHLADAFPEAGLAPKPGTAGPGPAQPLADLRHRQHLRGRVAAFLSRPLFRRCRLGGREGDRLCRVGTTRSSTRRSWDRTSSATRSPWSTSIFGEWRPGWIRPGSRHVSPRSMR